MKRLLTCILALMLTSCAFEPAYASQLVDCGEYTITFYCPCAKCCGHANKPTASGVMPQRWRTVATGKEFDFGTELVIEGFEQVRVVEDRGVGNGHIDIFVTDHNYALKLGTTKRHVYKVVK